MSLRKVFARFNNARGAEEYARLRAASPALLASSPKADGHPVLLLPGFSCDDEIITPFCQLLRQKGYDAHTWGGGTNFGLPHATAKHLRDKLEELYVKSGNRKVTLVGHSLGGIFARELAKEYPHRVRAVITIGSPIGLGFMPDAIPEHLKSPANARGRRRFSLKDTTITKQFFFPPPVPATSIFSKEDTVVKWPAALNPDTPLTDNVEVPGRHMKLITSPETFAVLLERLAQPEGAWKKSPQNYQGPLPPQISAGSARKPLFPK